VTGTIAVMYFTTQCSYIKGSKKPCRVHVHSDTNHSFLILRDVRLLLRHKLGPSSAGSYTVLICSSIWMFWDNLLVPTWIPWPMQM